MLDFEAFPHLLIAINPTCEGSTVFILLFNFIHGFDVLDVEVFCWFSVIACIADTEPINITMLDPYKMFHSTCSSVVIFFCPQSK